MKECRIYRPPDDFRGQSLINAFAGKTALIFASSKQQLELYADLTGRLLLRAGWPNLFAFTMARYQNRA